MKLHANARLSLKGRELLIERVLSEGWSLTQAAEAAGVSDRTAAKWVCRFRLEGREGLLDRSSAPRSSPSRMPEERVQVIAALRRLRMTGAEIAECLGMAGTTVSGILTKIGMGKLGRLGLEPAVRYERELPGELIHVDVKKLGRISRPGWRVTGDAGAVLQLAITARPITLAGSSCMSASMTRLAWPTSRFSMTREPRPRSASYAARSASTPRTGSA